MLAAVRRSCANKTNRTTVDGETFVVRPAGKGDSSYAWMSGPDPGDGVSDSTSLPGTGSRR
ncbi:hypothetical protein [Sediminivirga luteola]|uniref:Uncharacterized protein n=1 Tax=Sediminivirga luteola TaxID=1774748 RepID=A0A8J2XM20_9MICO|nr:hypothetical protein [Sediminivirga luteola]MCI2266019.1 hypothetical protein [Sediminivirga luteola]GGA27981.1 hypothetical protein GCM10011333_33430 [Sediminivirga luteola]